MDNIFPLYKNRPTYKLVEFGSFYPKCKKEEQGGDPRTNLQLF